MDPLEAYIKQARQQGQNDQQIRQALIDVGWAAAQVNSVLPGGLSSAAPAAPSLASALTDQQKVKRGSKRTIALLSLLVFVVVIGFSSYALFGHGPQSSYQAVTQAFVKDIEYNDKTKADALESPALKAEVRKYANTTSFYSACQQEGALCTAAFSSQFLHSAKKSYSNYTATNGTKGMELIYTEKQTLSGAKAGGQGCSSTSTTTLSLGAIAEGHVWFVDSINDGSTASAKLCLAPGGKSSVGSPVQ